VTIAGVKTLFKPFDKFIVVADLMNSRLDKIKKNVKQCFWALTKYINEKKLLFFCRHLSFGIH
jgi:hypothetical protein